MSAQRRILFLWTAELSLIHIFEELPAYMNAMDAIAPDAAEIHPGTPNAFFETNCIKGPDFDWDSIPDSQQVEIESYCSRQPHLHLEPDCGYGYIDEDGMITVHRCV